MSQNLKNDLNNQMEELCSSYDEKSIPLFRVIFAPEYERCYEKPVFLDEKNNDLKEIKKKLRAFEVRKLINNEYELQLYYESWSNAFTICQNYETKFKRDRMIPMSQDTFADIVVDWSIGTIHNYLNLYRHRTPNVSAHLLRNMKSALLRKYLKVYYPFVSEKYVYDYFTYLNGFVERGKTVVFTEEMIRLMFPDYDDNDIRLMKSQFQSQYQQGQELSLDGIINEDATLYDVVGIESDFGDSAIDLEKIISSSLTSREKEVLDLHLEGYKGVEIADKLSMNSTRVSQLLNNARKKIKEKLESGVVPFE